MIINENKPFKYVLVGALTSKPYAFTARSWELKNTETIDLFDSICSNIRIDTRGSDIMRILPVNNESLNEEWISDKTRFAYDALKRKRFVNPMIRQDDLFIQSSWKNIFSVLETKFNNTNFNKLIINTGYFNDLEHLTVLNEFQNHDNILINPDDNRKNFDLSKYYTVNFNELLNVKGKKVYILIGTNLRLENPILNIKLRRLSQDNNILIGYIGPKYNYNINLIHLGSNISNLYNIIKGKHPFCTVIQNFVKKNNSNIKINNNFTNTISLLFGNEFIQLNNSSKILHNIEQLKNSFIKFDLGVLELYSGNINKAELGLTTKKTNNKNLTETNLYYLLNSEVKKNISENDFIIFQGTHNEKMRTKFNIILPSLNWVEKSGLYLNCFGFVQKTHIAITAPKNARADWKITTLVKMWLDASKNKLASKTSKTFTHIDKVHNRLNQLSPNIMKSIAHFTNAQKLNISYNSKLIMKNNFDKTVLKSFLSNFYHTNSIDKNSKVMQNCTQLINKNKNNFTKN